VDLSHLANANAIAHQVKGVPEFVKAHLETHLKESKVGPFSESADAKLSWEQKERLMSIFGAVETALYGLRTWVNSLEPRIASEMTRIFVETMEKNDTGRMLLWYGPRLLKLENRMDVVEECATDMKTAVANVTKGVSQSHSSVEKMLESQLKAIFNAPIDLANLPSHVSLNYLRDRLASDRDRIYREIAKLR